jgi:hypothetical protein
MRGRSRPAVLEAGRAEVAERLRARRAEIEAAVGARVYSVADPSEVSDPSYLEGFRASLSAAVEFGLASIALGERRSPQVPAALLTQARIAARNDIGLATVLRRYFAGYAQIAEFTLEEVAACEAGALQLHEILRGQAAVFDRLLAEVSAEYAREAAVGPQSPKQRRAERVRRLLDGESIDSSDLGYELGDWHLAAAAAGEGAEEALRALASALDRRLLAVRDEEGGTIWAWFGSCRAPEAEEVWERLQALWPAQTALALGEPGLGTAGWRLSHRQAAAAFPLARQRGAPLRYAEVALLISTLRDDLLASSLHQLYLAPLEGRPGEGEMLRETLRAYLAAGRNVTAAAAALKVSRQTVRNRLAAIEERLGRYVESCSAELEAALRLDELGETASGLRVSGVGRALP